MGCQYQARQSTIATESERASESHSTLDVASPSSCWPYATSSLNENPFRGSIGWKAEVEVARGANAADDCMAIDDGGAWLPVVLEIGAGAAAALCSEYTSTFSVVVDGFGAGVGGVGFDGGMCTDARCGGTAGRSFPPLTPAALAPGAAGAGS
jgi:hypothetical protein